jgi:magnesium transporter
MINILLLNFKSFHNSVLRESTRKKDTGMAIETYPPPGSPPGMLAHRTGEVLYPSRLRLIWYDADNFEEKVDATLADFENFKNRQGIKWLHLEGLQDLKLLLKLGESLGCLHPLALEDVVDDHAPVKVDDYPNYLFIVSRLVTDLIDFSDEQISMFLGPDYLFSIQETATDHFALIRERLRHGSGQIRTQGPDYLSYAIMDFIIDSWFPLLENFGERIEDLEDRLLSQPDGKLTIELQTLRRQMLRGRRVLWQERELINNLLDQEGTLIREHTRIYLRDIHDHAFQAIDLLENYRDIASSLIDIYLASVNNRLNEVMKVLTVSATIFMPLTFIAGVYGMNFKTEVSPWNMPELNWYYGYPFALGLMAMVTITMLIYFKNKKWL